jgi:SAM-dependent methyltransferase
MMDHEAAPCANRLPDEPAGHDGRALSSTPEFAAATTIVAELLCERVDLHPGQRVLDVATGTGNGALAAARRGCRSSGIHRASAPLERARERARAERLRASFQLGDAEAIPFPDASFDVVLSIFGVAFAPDGRQAASELVRVCRPGGTIALATWTPQSVIGTLFRRTARQMSAARRLSDPTTWGTRHGLRSLIGAHTRALVVSPRTFVFRCRSPEHFLELMQIYYRSTRSSLQPSDRLKEDAVVRAMTPVVRRFNRAENGSMIMPSEYLEVLATKR